VTEVHVNRPPPPISVSVLERRIVEVGCLRDDELVATARRLGIPDPYGLTRARLVAMVARRS
jgi:hypothetical protein